MKEPKQRILDLIKKTETDCWEWQGTKKGKDKLKQYGNMVIGSRKDGSRKTVSAHRYAYEVFVGKIPSGMWVLHHCDNPSCVNPDHLFLGDRQANINDREIKGRNKVDDIRRYGEAHHCAVLNWNIVRIMRNSGLSATKLSRKYRFKRRTILDVLKCKTWKPEPPCNHYHEGMLDDPDHWTCDNCGAVITKADK
jgi:hypothetical protein